MPHLAALRSRMLRRSLSPAGATGAITALAGLGLTAGAVAGSPGWLLAWLLLGLTAGYALSGSV
ncbi:MAG: hypothetical protein GEU94_15855 [Micromonosporaceae bacterium]|nr:hypothetical protein [Micromonosporaceae bacterium]